MRKLIWILGCLAWLSWAGHAAAGEAQQPPPKPAEEGCGQAAPCAICGCHAPCKKVCRLVCETKKVEETVWEVQCEDFCPLLPKIFGKKCGCGDAGCGQDPAASGGCEVGCGKEPPLPQCGKSRTKKTLVKKTITKEVPVYRCVVEYVCDGCEGGCGATAAPAAPAAPEQKAAPAPPPPPPAPKAPPKAAFRSPIQPAAAIPEAPEQPLPRLVLGG